LHHSEVVFLGYLHIFLLFTSDMFVHIDVLDVETSILLRLFYYSLFQKLWLLK